MSEPESPARRKIPRNIWALSGTSFFMDVSSEMILNVLPLFLANVLGVGTAVIGLIEGVAESTASLLKVFAGGHAIDADDWQWGVVRMCTTGGSRSPTSSPTRTAVSFARSCRASWSKSMATFGSLTCRAR